MDFVYMVDSLRQEGYSDREINNEIALAMMEEEADFIESYENDPGVQYGWYQQDIIDSYRRER